MYGHKKSRYSTAACAPSENFVVAAKMRKVFGTCKGEGRKCVAEHVFCGKRKGSREGEPWSTSVEYKLQSTISESGEIPVGTDEWYFVGNGLCHYHVIVWVFVKVLVYIQFYHLLKVLSCRRNNLYAEIVDCIKQVCFHLFNEFAPCFTCFDEIYDFLDAY